MVIDSHTNAWGHPSRDHPWVNGPILDLVGSFSVDSVYTAEKLLADMDRTGVDQAVVVGYPICDRTDNWHTERVAREHDRLHGVVMLDRFADDAAARLREAMAVEGVVGLRLGAACPYDRICGRRSTPRPRGSTTRSPRPSSGRPPARRTPWFRYSRTTGNSTKRSNSWRRTRT